MIKYIPYTNNKDIGEIYQVSGLRFALMSSKAAGNMQCHQWVKCRDFLGDVVRSWLLKKPIKIYNFEYDPKTDPKPYTRKLRLLVKNDENKDFQANIIKFLSIIHRIEGVMRIPRTTRVFMRDDKGNLLNNMILLEANAVWIKSPALLSLFTLLIRVGEQPILHNVSLATYLSEFEKLAKYKSPDTTKHYLHFLYDTLPIIYTNVKELFFVEGAYDPAYTVETSINDFHDHNGIVSLVTNKYVNKLTNTIFRKHLEKFNILSDYPELKNTCSKPIYNPTSISYAVIKKITTNTYMANYKATCREEVVNDIRAKLKKLTPAQLETFMQEPYYFMGICPLGNSISSFENNKIYYDLTLKYINNLSCLAGFEPCKLIPCKVSYRNSTPIEIDLGYIFKMDKQWLKSPVLLTMLLVIIRNMPNYLERITESKLINIDSLKENSSLISFYDIFDKEKPIVRYFKQAQQIATFISLKHNNLFKDMPIERTYFFKKKGYHFFRNNGINSLYQGSHFDKRLNARYENETI